MKDLFGATKEAIVGDDNPKAQAALDALKKRLIEEGRERGEPVDDPFWLRAKLIEEGKRLGNEKIAEVAKEIPGAIKNLFTVDEKQQALIDKLRAKVIEEGRKKGEPVDDFYWLRAKMIEEGERQDSRSCRRPSSKLGIKELQKASNMPVDKTTPLQRLGVAAPGAIKLGTLLEGVQAVGGMAIEEATAGELVATLKKELAAAGEAGEGALVAEGNALKQRLADAEAERAAQAKELTAETKKPQPFGESDTPPDTRFTDAKLDNKQLEDALAGTPGAKSEARPDDRRQIWGRDPGTSHKCRCPCAAGKQRGLSQARRHQDENDHRCRHPARRAGRRCG